MPGAASRSTPSSCRRVLSAIGLSLAALDRRLGQIKCRQLLCSSADSATATRRRGRIDRHRYRGTHRPGGIRRPSCVGSHEPMSQRLPYPRTNPPWAVPVKPTSAGPGPTEREPRSHCFDVTHQVRGGLVARRPTSERAAKGTRHRRGHIISPGGWRPAAKWPARRGAHEGQPGRVPQARGP